MDKFALCFVLTAITALFSCNALVQKPVAQPEHKPDTALARELGADEYGMHHYVMALLKKGPNRSQDSATAAALQAGHMANIKRMADEGKLAIAGPFMDNGEIRGIYIFDVRTVEEAKALTETDPAIKAGRLVMELHPWYGSAALLKVNEIHKKIQTKGF